MDPILYFLNNNAGAVQGISTIILLLITSYYAIQTRLSVTEAANARKDMRIPVIRIGIGGPFESSSKDQFWTLVDMKNVGYGIARQITLHMPTRSILLAKALDTDKEWTTNVSLSQKEHAELLSIAKLGQSIRVTYKDIFSREVQTVSILEMDPQQPTSIHVFGWDLVLPS